MMKPITAEVKPEVPEALVQVQEVHQVVLEEALEGALEDQDPAEVVQVAAGGEQK
jgi:hypothetical protein